LRWKEDPAAHIALAVPDVGHLIPVIDRAEQAVGTGPRGVLADAGDRSEENFERLRERNIDGFISPGCEGKAPKRTQLERHRPRIRLVPFPLYGRPVRDSRERTC
jgi:hypothetical protein